jgi:CHAD domain-containing protein
MPSRTGKKAPIDTARPRTVRPKPSVTDSIAHDSKPAPQTSASLSQALRRVLKTQSQARKKLPPDSIHDLRVALRRSRSLAEGFSELDTYAGWRQLRKACKALQGKLAGLRDLQVMQEWIRKLGIQGDAGGADLAEQLSRQEEQARHHARAALKDFSRKQWKQWKRRMPERADALPFNEPYFGALALRRLKEVQELERRRKRNPSSAALHRLRIGVKKLRYTVESFLPEQQEKWGKALRRLQRLLGEAHDLDVLRAKLQEPARHTRRGSELQAEGGANRLALIDKVREERIASFDRLTSPKHRPDGSRIPQSTLWDGWKRELESLLEISLPESEEPSRSTARRAKRSTGKASSARGRRLRLS